MKELTEQLVLRGLLRGQDERKWMVYGYFVGRSAVPTCMNVGLPPFCGVGGRLKRTWDITCLLLSGERV